MNEKQAEARLAEIRRRNDSRKKFRNAGDATLVATTDDIDFLLFLLQQPAISERCGECGHGGKLRDGGLCSEVVIQPSVRTDWKPVYCPHKCVFPATDAPDYERGYVKGHKAGAQLATRAMLASVSRAEVVEAITDMQEGRDSHQQWLDHLSNSEREDCKGCDDHTAHIGDVEHHRQWVERYDRVIRLLALVPLNYPSTEAAQRKYFCSCGMPCMAEEYIEHYFEQGHDRGEGAQVAVEARETAERIVGSTFENTGASHETLRATMVDRITDYIYGESVAAIISKHCTADAGEVERLRFISRLLALAAKYDIHDSLFWHSDLNYFGVNVSDVFGWGCADLEEVTSENIDYLEQAIVDCQATLPDSWEGYGPWLFAARNRKTRPQGASYPGGRELWPLFDACGPERETGFGNPYKLGAYSPTTEVQRLAMARANAIRECVDILNERVKAYDESIFKPPTQQETQRVHKQWPGLVDCISAAMGRITLWSLITEFESLAKKEGDDGPTEAKGS